MLESSKELEYLEHSYIENNYLLFLKTLFAQSGEPNGMCHLI